MILAGAAAPAFSLRTLHEFYKRLIMDLMFNCYHSFERQITEEWSVCMDIFSILNLIGGFRIMLFDYVITNLHKFYQGFT